MINQAQRRVILVPRKVSAVKNVRIGKPTKTTQITNPKIGRRGINPPPPLIPVGVGGVGELPPESKKAIEKETLDSWKRKLRELPVSTQKTLSDFLLLELRSTQKLVPSQDRDVEMWIHSVQEALQTTLKKAPTGISRKSPLWEPFVTSFGEIHDFLVAAGIVGLQSTQRKGLYNLLAKLLVAHSKSLAGHIDVPVSPKFVCGQSHMIAGLFENAWPGYLEAGLAVRVVQSLAALEKNI